MKIYTKTGDDGMTSLVGGQRVSKCCDRLESYGTIDELNSFIGMLITQCGDERDRAFLTQQQGILFVVGGYLATDNSQHEVRQSNIVTDEMVSAVEQEIDRLDAIVPPLKLFILPGGTQAAAIAHVCRTVCRRAERCIYRLRNDNDNTSTGSVQADDANQDVSVSVNVNVTKYVNRLSDYFFVLARKLNADSSVSDVVWKRI